MTSFFTTEHRALQTEMGTAGIADRIASTRRHSEFSESDSEIVGNAEFFFVATSANDGTLDCSVKCGPRGFVQLRGGSTLAFPDYDGNGMFRTLGNIRATRKVSLLFLEFSGQKRKLRIQGDGQVSTDPTTVSAFPGAQAVVLISVTDIFPNCPRYLPTMTAVASSEFVDALGKTPLEPLWKGKPDLKDFVHNRKAF